MLMEDIKNLSQISINITIFIGKLKIKSQVVSQDKNCIPQTFCLEFEFEFPRVFSHNFYLYTTKTIL